MTRLWRYFDRLPVGPHGGLALLLFFLLVLAAVVLIVWVVA